MVSSQATNQSSNESTSQNMGFINRPLLVVMAVPGSSNPGVTITDTLTFTSMPNKIWFQHNFPQSVPGSIPPSPPIEWGSWAPTNIPNTLTGQTLSGQPATIVYDANQNQVTCTLDDPPPQQGPFSAIALGALLGALIGAVVGFVAGSPLLGTLIGLVSASTGSAAAARILQSDNKTSGGQIVTWVANDGGSPTPGPHLGPRTLQAVS